MTFDQNGVRYDPVQSVAAVNRSIRHFDVQNQPMTVSDQSVAAGSRSVDLLNQPMTESSQSVESVDHTNQPIAESSQSVAAGSRSVGSVNLPDQTMMESDQSVAAGSRSRSYSCDFWYLSCEYNRRGRCIYCFNSHLSSEYSDDDSLDEEESVDGEKSTDGVIESSTVPYSCDFWYLTCDISRGRCRYCFSRCLLEQYPLSPDLLDGATTGSLDEESIGAVDGATNGFLDGETTGVVDGESIGSVDGEFSATFSSFEDDSNLSLTPEQELILKKHKEGNPSVSKLNVHSMIKVFWAADNVWYHCIVDRLFNNYKVKLMYDDGEIDDCINLQEQAWKFVQVLSIKMHDKMIQAGSVVLLRETEEPNVEYFFGEVRGIYDDGTS